MKNSAQPTAIALRSMLGTMIGRRMIHFEDPPIPAPPAPAPKPEDKKEDPPVEETPEQKEQKEKEALELRWKGLKLPEGQELIDPKLSERTVAEARKRGLSFEQAEGVLVFVNQEAAAIVDAAVKAHSPGGAEWNKQVETWEEEALNDLDIGAGKPERLQAAVTKARAVLDKFFPPSVKKYLHETGFGSRPDIIKGFLNIAKAAGEGTFDVAGPEVTKDRAKKFYGGSEKK